MQDTSVGRRQTSALVEGEVLGLRIAHLTQHDPVLHGAPPVHQRGAQAKVGAVAIGVGAGAGNQLPGQDLARSAAQSRQREARR